MLTSALDHLELAGAIVVGGVTLVRVRMVRQADSRVLWVALLTLTVAQTIQVEVVYRAVDRWVGTPGAAALLKHDFALLTAANTAAVVGALVGTDTRNHWRSWLAAATAILVGTLPWLVDPPTTLDPSLRNRAEYYDTSWRSLVLWGSLLVYLGWVLLGASRVCWRFRQVEEHPPTRTAGSLVGLGTTIGLGYVAEKLVTVLTWATGHGPGSVLPDQIAEAVILASSVSLIAIGTAYEAGYEQLAAWRREQEAHRVAREIRPLARMMRREFPDIASPAAFSASEQVVAAVAVVHEGLRRLTGYAKPPAMEASADHLQVRWLRQALAEKASGREPAHPGELAPVADAGESVTTARALIALFGKAEREQDATGPEVQTVSAEVHP